jgi:hypothetical protein
MFRALLAHLQEALYKRHLLHQDWSGTPILVQPTDTKRMQYAKCRLRGAS